MKISTFAILLILVGGATVSGVFASHDPGIEHFGTVRVDSDSHPPDEPIAQVLINSPASEGNELVLLEAKGHPGDQGTFNVIGVQGGDSVFSILTAHSGDPILNLSDVDDPNRGIVQYKLRLNDSTGELVLAYTETGPPLVNDVERMTFSPNGDICIGDC